MDSGQWTSKNKKKFSIVNSQLSIVIGYLYGDLMNIYGDTGNIIALTKRAEWRGIDVIIKMFSIGNKMKKGQADIFFFGGGQDQQQELVARDLVVSNKGKVIKQEVERGVPLLSICGGYQLLGDYYKPHKGPRLPGVGLFPAYTVASFDRMIGNIIVKSSVFCLRSAAEDSGRESEGLLVGFENHSGKTYLKKGATPLGMVINGWGNNGKDEQSSRASRTDGRASRTKTEGCLYKNAIGCYMHGSLLPKNPKLADWLLKKALEVKYGKVIELETLDDTLELQAHHAAIQKFS